MDNLLYYKSQNAHIKKYQQEIKEQEIIDQYQLARNKLMREGQINLLSQAQIINQLQELQDDLIKNKKSFGEIIPIFNTSSPEIEPEKYSPLTSSQYENAISKGYFKIENRKQLLKELKDKIQKNNKVKVLLELKQITNKKEVEKVLKNLIDDVVNNSSSDKIGEDELLKAAENQLKKIKVNTRVSSSVATTSMSSQSSPTAFYTMTLAQRSTLTNNLKQEFKNKGIAWPYNKKGVLSSENMRDAEAKLGR